MKFSRFADDFHSKKLPLNLLINNAGVVSKNFVKSADGIEQTFAVNHLGHCKNEFRVAVSIHEISHSHLVLLTNLLLDDLKCASPSRVVVVSSKLHDPTTRHGNPPDFKWSLDEINNVEGYDGMTAYKNSKLANVWFAYELARRLENTGVDVHVICPVRIHRLKERVILFFFFRVSFLRQV